MKTRNDFEIACDCVKRANVVLHVGLCKEIFSRKHTATHKPTSAQPFKVTTMIHIHALIACGAPWPTAQRGNKIAGRLEPRRPPMKDEGTETAFRTGPVQAFPKK